MVVAVILNQKRLPVLQFDGGMENDLDGSTVLTQTGRRASFLENVVTSTNFELVSARGRKGSWLGCCQTDR